jgi:Nucleotidyl transferase AbiEii toxin, Type IV TA system
MMNIARQTAKYEEKGFSREKAEINALMENAILAIFRDFPDAFLLFGGATLVLFHESVRHSADLDLLPRGTSIPKRDEIIDTLKREVSPIAQTLQLGELQFEATGSGGVEGSIFVSSSSGQRLFRVDLTKFGSAIESEIETHPMESQWGESVDIKSPTKELLLLQKAEAILLRRIVKARDAYDIYVLLQKGAVLSPNLRAHLEDAMHANEIDGEATSERIGLIDIDRCTLELKPILPPEIYTPLEEGKFEKLRDAVKKLFEEWV